MQSLTTMICVTLIIVQMILSVKGADPSAFRSNAVLADDVKAAGDGEVFVRPSKKSDEDPKGGGPTPIQQPVMKPLTPFSCFTPTTLPYFICVFPPFPKPTKPPVQICFPPKPVIDDTSRNEPDAPAPFMYA